MAVKMKGMIRKQTGTQIAKGNREVEKMTQAEKDKKLQELILYICKRCGDDETLGAIKLNKLLFYVDFSAYLTLGKSITGQEYFRLPKGPAPKRLVPVREQMKKSNAFAIMIREWHGYI